MIEAPHYTPAGDKRSASFALPAEYFDGTVNEPVLHQAVKVFLNNQRQGTAATKTRSFVSGGNQKPWKQKGTGRARQGSTRAPHWRRPAALTATRSSSSSRRAGRARRWPGAPQARSR